MAGKTRPTIARFLRYPDRERVLRASFGLSRELEIRVVEDFPKEIIEQRRKQMPKLKEAKKKGLKVAFSKTEPDKLFINGKFVPMKTLYFPYANFFSWSIAAYRQLFSLCLKEFTPYRLS